MPKADKYVASLVGSYPNKTAVKAHILSRTEATSLSLALRDDAADFYYSAWVTFVDSLNGIRGGFYSWSKVKAYYSVFYALRASLAESGICAFHTPDGSAYAIEALAGKTPQSSTDRGTHKTVLNTFKKRNPNHVLMSQNIDLDPPLDWLRHQREHANYGAGRFGEPDCGAQFSYAAGHGLRKALNAYLADTTFLYVFDADHALVAYPLTALQHTASAATTQNITDDEREFLRDRVRDQAGTIPALLAEMKRLSVLS